MADATPQKMTQGSFDVEKVRQDFPILKQTINDHPLIYLDNAATTQKPQVVIDTITNYYQTMNANVHRAVHTLGDRATRAYENARTTAQRFINAPDYKDIIFVRGCTEGINLVAQSFLAPRLRPGEEIIVTEMAHHSNLVPWQMVGRRTGANLRVVTMDDYADLDLEVMEKLLSSDKARFLALGHVSNAFGTISPIKKIIEMAHAHDVTVLVDGAQAGPHVNIDVQDLDCDFYTMSGHKMYGPTGIGVLYGRQELLQATTPYQGGGEMITYVSFEQTDFQDPPYKFEAGTPNIAGAIGLAAAMDYILQLGHDNIIAYEKELLDYATEALHTVKGAAIVGTAKEKASILSFNIQGVHHQDVGTMLNSLGIAIRCGHHCTMPAMAHFDIAGSARMSLCFYNTKKEIDTAIKYMHDIKKIFTEK